MSTFFTTEKRSSEIFKLSNSECFSEIFDVSTHGKCFSELFNLFTSGKGLFERFKLLTPGEKFSRKFNLSTHRNDLFEISSLFTKQKSSSEIFNPHTWEQLYVFLSERFNLSKKSHTGSFFKFNLLTLGILLGNYNSTPRKSSGISNVSTLEKYWSKKFNLSTSWMFTHRKKYLKYFMPPGIIFVEKSISQRQILPPKATKTFHLWVVRLRKDLPYPHENYWLW